MKVAIVTHKFVRGDGQGRVNYEVAKAAARHGHEVILIASDAAPDLVSRDSVTWVQVPINGYPTELLRNQIFAWRSARWLGNQRNQLDLVMANGCITWAPAEINAVHFVHSAWRRSPVHSARIRRGPYAWYQWVYSALNAYWEKHAFMKAKLILAVSEQVRGELVELGLPAQSVQVIHNGVDTEEFQPGKADRTALRLPEDVPLALFVGEIQTPRKNVDTVLKALRKVPELHLAIAGSTERSPYPQLARDLEVHSRVHFLGFRRDVPDLMRAADLFVFPSRYEACSLVLLEAMASGLPIVTAHSAGGAELVTDACGIVVPDPDDQATLAQGLQELASDPTCRKEMGKAARAVAESHSWQQMAKQYLALFERHAP